MGDYPELWADKTPKDAITRTIRVKCTTDTAGNQECQPVLSNELLARQALGLAPQDQGDKEFWEAYNSVKQFTSGLGSGGPCFSRALSGQTKVWHPITVGGSVATAIPWPKTGLGGLPNILEWWKALIDKTGAVVSRVPHVLVGGAAVFGPSQAVWNKENQLIRYAVDEPKTFEVDVNVVPDAKSSTASPPPNNNNNKNYRTWKEIYRDWSAKIKSAYEKISAPQRWQRFTGWLKKEKVKSVSESDHQKPLENGAGRQTGESRSAWMKRRISDAFKEWWVKRKKHWNKVNDDVKNAVNAYKNEPLRETLDTLSRPAKLTFRANNVLGLATILVTLYRWISGSKETSPVGGFLVPDEYSQIANPILGVDQAGCIAQVLYYTALGYSPLASYIVGAIFGAGDILIQGKTGGKGLEDVDYTRINKGTMAGLLWAMFAIDPYRVAKYAFPGVRWHVYLEKLGEKHPTLAGLLKKVPDELSPKRAPTPLNFAANVGITYSLSYFLYFFTITAQDADYGEYYKFWTAQAASPSNLFIKLFELAYDPYLRAGPAAVISILKIGQGILFSPYFQLYEGKQFYRSVLHRLASEGDLSAGAFEEITDALAVKKPFGGWDMNEADCLDLFGDLNRGEFGSYEINYLFDAAISSAAPKEYKRVQTAMLMMLYNYSNQEVPFDWTGGSKAVEAVRRKTLKKKIAGTGLPEALLVEGPAGFKKVIENINNGWYDSLPYGE